ncbi:MAG: hypothetical protein DCC75_08875 [Proteobacteria bacterium]|nr:MAG: hypothetical protein DCC75_08875 [Pseudomonadota bacterium]
MLQDYYSPASGQYALIRFERSEQQFFRSIRLGPASDHISLHDRIESAVTKFALEETEFQGCSWRMVRTHEQQFNGSLFPKHLLPHLVQGSASLGLTLSDYTARLEADPAFLQSQREWLLLPFETVYGLSREGTGAVSGDWSNNFVEFLNNNTQSLGWALPEVVKLIKTKSEARDYKLKIVSAGCGLEECRAREILRSFWSGQSNLTG